MKAEDIKNIYRHDFSSFIRFAYQMLHPYSNYQHNWHIDVIANCLTKVMNNEIKRLIINLPPRTLKSHCASIAFPAFVLGRDPRKTILYLHNRRSLGQDLEDECENLIKSSRYRALFPQNIIQKGNNRLMTTYGGKRQHKEIMSGLTGTGADIIIIDDPISTDEVRKKQGQERLNRQFDENILQRLNNKNKGAIVLVMQRLHENDLTAHLLANNESWVHINIPSIALKDEIWELPFGKTHRRLKGKPIHPERENIEEQLEILTLIGGYAFAYQYLQKQYKPRFGEHGEGCIWITPLREGVFYDACKKNNDLTGFIKFKEADLIKTKVFGIGDDICPDNMRRSDLTREEIEMAYPVEFVETEVDNHHYSDAPDFDYYKRH